MPVAAILARRGYGDPAAAREFLEAREVHPPSAFRGMRGAVELVEGAIRDSIPITVYGDYDADGVAATSILVGLLRESGGRCDWFIPDRISEGYGLNEEAIRTISERGTGLVITVDCGIASPGEVELAKGLGMDVLVTDHHQFGEVLPDCALLHPVISEYPFEWLAGAGVAAKLASALRASLGRDPAGDESDLDLVALATVADVMPLIGENRRLVREGLAVIRRARRVGMRALLGEARVEPANVDSTDIGFRLAPRVNAVGRMYRADAGVELFLTSDPERAAEIGKELSSANAERRRVQQDVEAEARRVLAEQNDEGRSVAVVAGEGWHPGVVGIVAAHIARDEGMPAVVVAIEDGVGKGSARSVPGVDLHEAIGRQGDVLETFGGHSAAAGITVREENIDQFRNGLDRTVREITGGGNLAREHRIDAFAGGGELGMDLAGELTDLGPYGSANPSASLLIPSARILDPEPMGEGKHLRFTLVSGGHRARAVWFGASSAPDDPGNGFDVLGELSVNHWNGSVEPQFRVTEVLPVPRDGATGLASAESGEWWERFDLALDDGRPEGEAPEGEGSIPPVRHRGSAEAVTAELISSGESVLVVTAEAYRRWLSLGGRSVGRFSPDGAELVRGAWPGSPWSELTALGPPLALTDYETLALIRDSFGHFDNVVLFDPPASAGEAGRAAAAGGLVHRPFDPATLSFALAAASERHDPTPALRVVYRGLREDGPLGGEDLRALLAGSDDAPRSPERAAVLVRIMEQAGIGQREGTGPVREFRAVSSEDVDLGRSEEFRRQAEIHKEQVAFLRR